MESKLTEAYQCPICKNPYIKQKSADTCIKRCTKEKAAATLERKRKREHKKRVNLVRTTAESFYEVGSILEDLAADSGYNLDVQISGGIKLVTTSHSRPMGKDQKAYKWTVRTPEDKEHNEKYGKSLAFQGRIKGTFSRTSAAYTPPGTLWNERIEYFGDWLRVFTSGIHTGTGGGGKGFQYELTMYVEDFPHILKQYEKFLPLQDSRVEYLNLKRGFEEYSHQKRVLTAEYEAEYYKWKLFADPTWAVYNQEEKELREEIREINEKISKAASEKRLREIILDDEREEKTTPDSDFDLERFRKLSEIFEK